MNVLALENLCCAQTLPGPGDLDQHTLRRDAAVRIQVNQSPRLFDGRARVAREPSVDLRGYTSLDQFDDTRPECDQNVVELPAGVLAGRPADSRLDQWSIGWL